MRPLLQKSFLMQVCLGEEITVHYTGWRVNAEACLMSWPNKGGAI